MQNLVIPCSLSGLTTLKKGDGRGAPENQELQMGSNEGAARGY